MFSSLTVINCIALFEALARCYREGGKRVCDGPSLCYVQEPFHYLLCDLEDIVYPLCTQFSHL